VPFFKPVAAYVRVVADAVDVMVTQVTPLVERWTRYALMAAPPFDEGAAQVSETHVL
jgi:hypothetical protein